MSIFDLEIIKNKLDSTSFYEVYLYLYLKLSYRKYSRMLKFKSIITMPVSDGVKTPSETGMEFRDLRQLSFKIGSMISREPNFMLLREPFIF